MSHSLPFVVLAYAAYNVMYAGLSYRLGALTDRIGPPTVFAFGLVCFATGYLGLGLMSLSPAVGLLLSGARVSTAAAGWVIEAGAIGVSFGGAYLADLAFRGGVFSITSGIFPVVLAGAAALVAVVFPIGIAFTNGAQVDADEDRQRTPSFGLAPVDHGGVLFIAGRF